MTTEILEKRSILLESPLFDSDYFSKMHCNEIRDKKSVSTEIRYLNEKSLWPLGTSALFNGRFYIAGNEDLKNLSYPPIIHYISHGYSETRNPSALIDVDYIVSQIVDEELPLDWDLRIKAKKSVLEKFDGIYDLLKTTKVNPNIFFDNNYFLQKNELNPEDLDLPIQFFYSSNAYHPDTGKILETTPLFCMQDYCKFNRDVIAANQNPLEHLLTYGLKERRLNRFRDLISEEFLKNSADLYNDSRILDHQYYLSKILLTGQLAGPRWPSRFKSVNNAPLVCCNDRIKDTKVVVGSVLFENSKEELERLKLCTKKEQRNDDLVELNELYFVNDDYNMEQYLARFEPEKLICTKNGNLGFGAAHNILMERAFSSGADYYFGVNPDGYLVRNCVKSLVNFSRYFDDNALVEANTLPHSHPKWHDPVLFDTKWVSGVAFFVPRKIWEDIGGFDECIHMYCEDVDYSWRVKAGGYMLKTCPVANFFHDVTNRSNQVVDEEASSRRRKSMLMGAYYLALKWQSIESSELYLNMLNAEGLISSNEELATPEVCVSKVVADTVADFNHELRFSPSRFW